LGVAGLFQTDRRAFEFFFNLFDQMADQPSSPRTYLLNAEALALVLGYTDRIKDHENYQAIVTNETAVLLAHLATPELRQLYESRESSSGYKRHGELIPEMVDFYSTYSHQVDTSHAVHHIHDRIQLTSYMRENTMNARFEGKQVPKETVDQFKALEDDSAFHEVPIFIPTKGFTKVKPYAICQISHIPMEGLSREQLQERAQFACAQSFMALLDRFLLHVTTHCMKEGGHLIVPIGPYANCKLEREEPKVIIPVLSRCVMSMDRINDILILTHTIYAIKFDFDFKHWTPTILLD
jgi:hypothetical protein